MRQLSHSLCADVLNTVGPHVQSDVYNTLYVYLLFCLGYIWIGATVLYRKT